MVAARVVAVVVVVEVVVEVVVVDAAAAHLREARLQAAEAGEVGRALQRRKAPLPKHAERLQLRRVMVHRQQGAGAAPRDRRRIDRPASWSTQHPMTFSKRERLRTA